MIKVKIKEGKIVETKFPKLMKSNVSGITILFSEDGTGIIVNGNGAYSVGELANNWDMHNFEDFNGELTLKNK
jgi:hypothetical protein